MKDASTTVRGTTEYTTVFTGTLLYNTRLVESTPLKTSDQTCSPNDVVPFPIPCTARYKDVLELGVRVIWMVLSELLESSTKSYEYDDGWRALRDTYKWALPRDVDS